MIKRTCVLAFVLCGLAFTGCTTNPAKEEKQTGPIQAPGIEQLQSLIQKADVFYQTRDYAESKKIYGQIIEIDTNNLNAHYRLGNIAFRSQEWREARRRYEKVIDLQPRHTRAQYNLAMTYLTMAERHLKFYAANVDADADLEAVTKLIAALEEISNPASGESRVEQSGSSSDSPLDKLLDALSR